MTRPSRCVTAIRSLRSYDASAVHSSTCSSTMRRGAEVVEEEAKKKKEATAGSGGGATFSSSFSSPATRVSPEALWAQWNALTKKELTSRKLVCIAEAMHRREVGNRAAAVLSSMTSTAEGSTTTGGVGDPDDDEEEKQVDREARRDDAVRGGRGREGHASRKRGDAAGVWVRLWRVQEANGTEPATVSATPSSVHDHHPPTTTPPCPSPHHVGKNASLFPSWEEDNHRTLSLMQARKYSRAYLVISALLAHYITDAAKTSVLRHRRAMCSFALMNYKECVDDFGLAFRSLEECRKASIRHATAWKEEEPSEMEKSEKEASSFLFSSLVDAQELDARELYRTWIQALIMREDYTLAEKLYAHLKQEMRVCAEQGSRGIPIPHPSQPLKTKKTSGTSESGGRKVHTEGEIEEGEEWQKLERESAALTAVKKFRESVNGEDWEQARACLEVAKCVVEDTPLRVIQALTYLEVGEVDLAREILLPYLPLIPPPLKVGAASEASPEERQLRCNVEAHYLLVSVLLAKASIYSGSQYLNIAASLTQRCLIIHPCYTPALHIGHYLIELEDVLKKVEHLCTEKCFLMACETLTEALELDAANVRVCAMLLAKRADIMLSMGKCSRAIDDATQSLALDPSVSKTYTIRAKAYEACDQEAEAAADWSRAVALHPPYASILEEHRKKQAEKARRARRAREQAAAEQQRRWRQQQQQEKEEKERKEKENAHPKRSEGIPCGGATRPENAFQRPSYSYTESSSSASAGSVPHSPPPSSSEHPNSSSAHGARKRSAEGSGDLGGGAPRSTFYDDLCVPMTATTEQIRRAFKKLTLQCHPDKMVGASEKRQLEALELFKVINNAHRVLSDPARRAEYDITILMETS